MNLIGVMDTLRESEQTLDDVITDLLPVIVEILERHEAVAGVVEPVVRWLMTGFRLLALHRSLAFADTGGGWHAPDRCATLSDDVIVVFFPAAADPHVLVVSSPRSPLSIFLPFCCL